MIIHKNAVKTYADIGVSIAKQVLNEIEQIIVSKSYLTIDDTMSPDSLHPNMPSVSEDLQVIVSGGYLEHCCTLQLIKLREAGYNARLHPTANCPGLDYMIKHIVAPLLSKNI